MKLCPEIFYSSLPSRETQINRKNCNFTQLVKYRKENCPHIIRELSLTVWKQKHKQSVIKPTNNPRVKSKKSTTKTNANPLHELLTTIIHDK